MNVYHRKLYALVRSLEAIDWLGTDVSYIYNGLTCLAPHLEELRLWWENLDGKIGGMSSIRAENRVKRYYISKTSILEAETLI
jgi:hypothetical protein